MFRGWLGFAAAGIALAAGVALAVPGVARAADQVAVPPLKARVTDLTGTLTAAQLQTLEDRLRQFESRKGSQIAVLIVPSTQPESIEQYSIRVADAWKIGRANVDDGLILVIAKNDQRLRIEVGRGLEGAIPDVIAKRVIREVIAPHFLANDFFGGIVAGTEALMKLIEGEKLPPPKQQEGRHSSSGDLGSNFGSMLLPLLVASVVIGGLLSRVLGRFFGATVTGGIVGVIAWVVAGALFAAILGALLAFVFTLVMGRRRMDRGGWGGGGWSSGGGGLGGGGFGGGGFSGGGGGFGGGGASGSWGN